MATDSETASSSQSHILGIPPDFSLPASDNSDNSDDEDLIERGNVRFFQQSDLIESIINSLKTIPNMPKEIDAQKLQIAGELEKLFAERFKEIGAVETLQRMEAPVLIEEPPVSFEESGLRFDLYVRENFPASIKRGYLPLGELSDKKLRRRISVEKSRGKFPADLDRICLTQNECAAEQRDAVARVVGIRNSAGQKFAQFARRLVPQGFR